MLFILGLSASHLIDYHVYMNQDLVSIITPTFNCGNFISEAIESVLSQTYKNWEMIISDDCSTDNTYEVIKPYLKSDSRIKYIKNEEHSGAAIARNNAMRAAQGRWIAFLDSDDVWHPDKIERQVAFMEKNNYAFSYHAYSEIDEDGKNLGVLVAGKHKVNKLDMYACCWPGCLTVMYDAWRIGLIQIANVKKNNDTAIWLKVVKKSKCYFLDENLAKYRRRSGSTTPTTLIDKIKWHYKLFRDAEDMNVVSSFILMIVNILGNSYKKIFYVKKSKIKSL